MLVPSSHSFAVFPRRIVSLVPSQTELLFDLGLESEVVGITKFCVHPQVWFHSKERIGGTKTVNIKKLMSLQPDLVIANKEENLREQVEKLAEYVPVFMSDVSDFSSAIAMINDIGRITGKNENAAALIRKITSGFSTLTSPTKSFVPAAYLIWKNPYMAAGGDTFISDMMEKAGMRNVFQKESRYPDITIDLLKEKSPSVILLSSEPYPFKQKHIDGLQQHLPQTKILLVDGEMFSWYGSRLKYVPDYFRKLKEQLCGIAL